MAVRSVVVVVVEDEETRTTKITWCMHEASASSIYPVRERLIAGSAKRNPVLRAFMHTGFQQGN